MLSFLDIGGNTGNGGEKVNIYEATVALEAGMKEQRRGPCGRGNAAVSSAGKLVTGDGFQQTGDPIPVDNWQCLETFLVATTGVGMLLASSE